MPTFRGFIAIDVTATQKILEFEKEIKSTGADVKLVAPENIHITLKFLGDTDEAMVDQIETIIRDAVKGIEPFTIRLQGTGVFPNQKNIRVIWIGIEDGNIPGTIASTIDEHLALVGFEKEKRGFSSHLTIGRVKTARNKENLIKTMEKYTDIEFGTFIVDSIKLKKSDLTPQGPIYSTIKDIKL
jgi:2'-5' RNA ligase